MKATISRIQLDVDYRCPNCYLHLRLSGARVPQRNSIEVECPECLQKITLPAALKTFHRNKPTKTIKEDPVICKAILALRSQGYSAKDSKSLIKKSYNKHISLEELIKKAFLNDKQLKTRKV
jgi:predicted RNA-binding Zn-ribbon protein involved in translation (DUF1610 family)|tara:strand:- start:7608 stop:7973 length:366 start_codon:yes stop_codon:yes gene_type:complete